MSLCHGWEKGGINKAAQSTPSENLFKETDGRATLLSLSHAMPCHAMPRCVQFTQGTTDTAIGNNKATKKVKVKKRSNETRATQKDRKKKGRGAVS